MNLDQIYPIRAARWRGLIVVGFGLLLVAAMLAQRACAQSPTIISYTNTVPITNPAYYYGQASPYPSVITVTNFYGTLQAVTVTLSGVTSDEPSKLEIQVAGPSSAGVVVDLMYNAGFTGGNDAVSDLTLTFADDAASPPPLRSHLTSGTYQPSGTDDSDNLDETTNMLAGFIGTALAGDWSLYVWDTGSYDSPDPNIISNWSLTFYYLPLPVGLSDPGFNSQGQFEATLSGPIGTPMVVEGSTDLLTWTPIATNDMATSSVLFTDTNSVVPYLFYRAVLLSSLPVAVELSDPQFNSQGQFQATLSGPVGTPLVVEGSTDLLTWTPIATNAMAASSVLFTDTNSVVQYLFYRAVLPSSLPVTVEFSAPQLNGLGQFQATLSGQVGTPVVIESSPDLKNWTSIATNAMATASVVFTDTNSLRNDLFYRAATSP